MLTEKEFKALFGAHMYLSTSERTWKKGDYVYLRTPGGMRISAYLSSVINGKDVDGKPRNIISVGMMLIAPDPSISKGLRFLTNVLQCWYNCPTLHRAGEEKVTFLDLAIRIKGVLGGEKLTRHGNTPLEDLAKYLGVRLSLVTALANLRNCQLGGIAWLIDQESIQKLPDEVSNELKSLWPDVKDWSTLLD